MPVKFSDPTFSDFIKGKIFDNNCQFHFDLDLKVMNRDLILTNLVKGKKIIHVGCVDHLEIIEAKMKAGNWLHGTLMNSSVRCLGIDINPEGVKYLQEKHQIPDLVCDDIIHSNIPDIANEKWDYILLPEVVEHVPNPVMFLKTIKEKYGANIDKIVITVPNVFAFPEFVKASRNIELINSDHRYWFSPYTIIKVMNDAGITIENLTLTNPFWGPLYHNVGRRVLHRISTMIGKPKTYKKIKDMRFARGLLVTGTLK